MTTNPRSTKEKGLFIHVTLTGISRGIGIGTLKAKYEHQTLLGRPEGFNRD